MPGPWQLCFDDGHQQRYLPDRQAVLRYVLAIGPKAASKRFEVFVESGPVTDYLAMQGRFGHMLPEHIATIQVQANRNWHDIGMDVSAELREGEDPAKHLRLREETYSMPLNRGVGA